MHRRLLDPATSTRRTPAARQRLAGSAMTTALLDAGVRLLLAELEAADAVAVVGGEDGEGADGDGGADAAPARFFDCLSAARVCGAATAVGPLRTTAAHLRDRWPRHDDFVEDLLRYALWFEHHFEGSVAQAQSTPAELPPGTTVDDVLPVLAAANLYTLAVPVTSRVEVLSCALAASRPWLRAVQRSNYARSDAVWGGAFSGVLAALDLRLRAGVGLGDLARAVLGLGEGVNLRLMAHGQSEPAQEVALADFATGCAALVRAWTTPVLGDDDDDAAGPDDAETAGRALPAPPAPRADLADVLRRITDPATGTRRTQASRRRLAEDGITTQLLEGGLAVLGEEFGLGDATTGPRFFAALSGARVVAEARDAGHAATDGQLRDRWPRHDHYLDDLVGHALAQQTTLLADDPSTAHDPASAAAAAQAAATQHARRADGSPGFRLRLLLTTTATRVGTGQELAEFYRRADATAAAVQGAIIAAQGRRLVPGVSPEALARVCVAVAQGEVTRALATGDDGSDPATGVAALLRTTDAVFAACLVP